MNTRSDLTIAAVLLLLFAVPAAAVICLVAWTYLLTAGAIR